jgi:hypothetical protein
MITAFRLFASFGIPASVAKAWLFLAFMDPRFGDARTVWIPLAVVLTIFARFLALRQWAAIGACFYYAATTLSTVYTGIREWIVGWGVAAITLIILTWRGWNLLRPGL